MFDSLHTKIFIVNEWLDQLFNLSIAQKISDIHLEPLREHYRIRVRLDGLLHEALMLPKEQGITVVNRIKVLSHLDIAEQRLPQDGRLNDAKFFHADFRISTCPTVFGEKCVIRNLMTMKAALSIEELGMADTQKNIFYSCIQKPQGLILVTGPTGSGKTVTLYSALQFLNQPEVNIVSIEDPVEIKLSGINQVNIHPKIGLSFSHTLRAMLRQDPDIIMVGEMRDKETAEIAIAAAQTGHLVFSTLHTNNAIDSITRLQYLGIDQEQISSALSLIIAQRLVRKCAQEGFSGRTAIYEMIAIDETLKDMLLQPNPAQALKRHAEKTQWMSLQSHAKEKILAGITTHAEVTRVLGALSFP